MDKKCKFCSQEFYRANRQWCDDHCEKVSEAVETLQYHNQWRRGANIEMLPPERIGKAIDVILELFEE
jgi:hypothetical protein